MWRMISDVLYAMCESEEGFQSLRIWNASNFLKKFKVSVQNRITTCAELLRTVWFVTCTEHPVCFTWAKSQSLTATIWFQVTSNHKIHVAEIIRWDRKLFNHPPCSFKPFPLDYRLFRSLKYFLSKEFATSIICVESWLLLWFQRWFYERGIGLLSIGNVFE